MNFFKNIKNGMRKNTTLLAYSIIIAIISWFIISMTRYPSTTQTIQDIPVDIDITDTAAAANGLSVISCNVETVNVRITGNRTQIGNLSGDKFKAKIAAGNVLSTGTKTLSFDIICTDPSVDFKVESTYPETATVVFDKYETREFPVVPEIPNITFAEGKTIDNDQYACDPETVHITGPAAQLDKISECAAVSMKELQLDSSYSVTNDEIKLYAEDGTTIDQSQFKFDTTSFNLNIPVLTLKTVDLSVRIAGAPSNFKSDFLKFDLSADSITLASKTGQLSEFPNTFEIGTIALNDLDLGFTKTFIIDTQNYKNMSNLESVTVMLDDSNLGRKEFVINDFNITNAPDTYDFSMITQSLEVAVIGPKDVIEEITPGDIVANVNLLNSDKLTEGETFNWDVTISFPKYDNVWAVTQSKVTVSKKPKTTQTSGTIDDNESSDSSINPKSSQSNN